jgi:hypothetical protein
VNLCVIRPKIMQKEITRSPCPSLTLSELRDALRAGGDVDLIRSSVEMVLQALVDAEAAEVIGAGRHERSELRTNQRNGIRPKLVTTKAGDVELAIPKLRHGSFFPSILERRRRIDRALFAVVMEALRAWRVHSQGRRSRTGARWGVGDLQERGEPHLRRARRVSAGVSGSAPRPCRVPVCVLRRHLRESPSRCQDRLQGGDSGHRRES